MLKPVLTLCHQLTHAVPELLQLQGGIPAVLSACGPCVPLQLPCTSLCCLSSIKLVATAAVLPWDTRRGQGVAVGVVGSALFLL